MNQTGYYSCTILVLVIFFTSEKVRLSFCLQTSKNSISAKFTTFTLNTSIIPTCSEIISKFLTVISNAKSPSTRNTADNDVNTVP